LQHSIFHKLSSILWGVAVTAIVLLATYVSMGRYLSTNLQNWQQEVLTALNSRLPFEIKAQRLVGEWSSFTPEIVLHELELDMPDGQTRPLQLDGGRIGIDVFNSLATRSLQFTSLQLDGLSLRGELTEEGRVIIPGLTDGGGVLGDWLQEFLLNLEIVKLGNNRLQLSLPGGQVREFSLALHLGRDGSERHLRADLLSARGTAIRLLGRGLGNPFQPADFAGTLYLHVESGDLAAIADLFATAPPVWAQGELSSELWLNWNQGEAELDIELSLLDTVISDRDGSWALPLDGLSLQAKLLERRNRWTIYGADLSAASDGVEVTIGRLQLDTWGDSLRLRTAELALEPLNQLLSQASAVPEALRSVLATLNLRGELSALELSVNDFTDPFAGWDIEGNFDRLQVDSWKGAPGASSGTGYFELSDAGGYVVIDSQQFSMDFPTVYEQPLYYDDFHGTLHLDWDSDSLLLHSGVITATGAEGTARALFSLNIPFSASEVGLEMDLMVGLADSHPIHRAKYIPYTLNSTLLDWLSSAVGDGDVEQAGFVWRGSLRPDASALRTVQLMLNLDNTALAYHPDWPPVGELKGTVLIDDTNVSVWAEQARLYDSDVEHLSAEAWMGADAQMRLALEGRIRGSAADGLRAVNESLLGRLTSGVFDDWSVSGALQTHLQLELNLADISAPTEVAVAVDLANVDMVINPGRLPVTGLEGRLRYSSAAGFYADELQGQLWGRSLQAQVGQRSLRGTEAPFTLDTSALEVALQGSVDAADLQDWLALDVLALATGVATVEGLVTVIPGETSLLTLETSLDGVALDLPAPWTKPADSSQRLELALPLGADATVLGLAFGKDLSLHLDISGGALRGAALGLSAPPPELQEGAILAQGRAQLVDVDAWLDFVSRYLLPADASEPGLDSSADGQGEAQPGAFRLGITGAQADRLVLWGREYNDVSFSAQRSSQQWSARGSTDWVQGSYRQPEQGPGQLQLDFLDVSAREEISTDPADDDSVEEAGEPLSFPPMEVSIAELRLQGEAAGSLDFRLRANDGEVLAEDIVGDLVGMRLESAAPGALRWIPDQGSSLLLPLQFDDIGDSLGRLGYARFLETERGAINLDLRWPGSPESFALVALEGGLTVDIGAGRFLQTPGGAGALKVVEILNLAGIIQGLSLSNMFESGLGFDTMDGEMFFHSGTLEVASLSVRGRSSAFSMSGLSDIATRSLDGELVATLPVANNLPWVAALTAGPAVAAGVFVVSKVFEKQVNRLSSGVYSIKGTWDEPQVNFTRIFDDEVRLDAMPSELAVDPNSRELSLPAAGKAESDTSLAPPAAVELPATGAGQAQGPP